MIQLPGLPPLSWQIEALDAQASASTLQLKAGAKTDLFSDPQGKVNIANAPYLTFDSESDFMLTARVTVDFRSTFDAGVLLVYQDPYSWAKFCFEYTPAGEPSMVSVVTKGSSDDCNSALILGNSVYMRLSRLGYAWAFHYSTDGKFWHMVRVFALDVNIPSKVGFLVQSPTGEGCTAQFSEVRLTHETLADLRSGV